MKKTTLLLCTLLVMLSSCAGLKNSSRSPMQSRRASSGMAPAQRPHRVLRTVEPCIELVQNAGDKIRSYGTAISYDEKVALNEAEIDARRRMANMLKVAVEGAVADYAQAKNKNYDESTESIGEVVLTQFLSNTRVINTSIYDLSDGSIQVYVCIEMRGDNGDIRASVNSTLDNSGF